VSNREENREPYVLLILGCSCNPSHVVIWRVLDTDLGGQSRDPRRTSPYVVEKHLRIYICIVLRIALYT
jgi:hypothetical protein